MNPSPQWGRLYRHGSIAVVVADDRVLFVLQAVELRIVDPGLLNEFELASDIGVDRDEQQPPFAWLAGCGCAVLIGTAAPDYAMPVGGP
jgi:hypothetical protein